MLFIRGVVVERGNRSFRGSVRSSLEAGALAGQLPLLPESGLCLIICRAAGRAWRAPCGADGEECLDGSFRPANQVDHVGPEKSGLGVVVGFVAVFLENAEGCSEVLQSR